MNISINEVKLNYWFRNCVLLLYSFLDLRSIWNSSSADTVTLTFTPELFLATLGDVKFAKSTVLSFTAMKTKISETNYNCSKKLS